MTLIELMNDVLLMIFAIRIRGIVCVYGKGIDELLFDELFDEYR